MVVSSAYLRLLIFLLAVLIPACASSSPVFLMMYSAYELNKQGDDIQPWRTPFPIWNQSVLSRPVLLLLSDEVSREAGQVDWYSHFFQNFPQFTVIHTVKGFGIVHKAEIYVFLELSCFLMIQWMLAIWFLVPLSFLKPAWTSGSLWFTALKPGLENFEYYFTSVWDECNFVVVWAFFCIAFPTSS